MKKTARRIFSAILVVVAFVATSSVTVFAAEENGRYYKTYQTFDSSWEKSTEMVDWSNDRWTSGWTDYLTDTGKNSRNFVNVVEAAYSSTVSYAKYNDEFSNISNAELAKKKVPQYSFSEALHQVADYDNGGTRPLWTCGDYCRFMVGLLRSQGIPAYIEIGEQKSTKRLHTRVAIVDEKNRRIYFSDPTYGATNGTKWMWLSKVEYDDNFKYSSVYGETDNTNTVVNNPDYTTVVVNIPSSDRHESTIAVSKKGFNAKVPMRVIEYSGEQFFWIRDIAKILEDTGAEIWIKYSGTLYFGKGDYVPSGELNWTRGETLSVDKTAQAYKIDYAYCENKRVRMDLLVVGGVLYAKPNQIANAVGVDNLNLDVTFKKN